MKIPETYAELRAMPKEQIPLLWLQITHNPTALSPKNLVRPLRYRIQCTRYTNTCNVPLSTNVCLSNDGQHIIIERPVIINNRVSTNRYEACGRTVMTMQENNLQLTRALAYGWRYRSMFERGQNAQQIAKTEHKAERTIYKYLALAYLSPKIVSDIMDGAAPAVDLQTLFAIAAKHMDFKEQENMFYKLK